jgi:septum formation protein
MRHNYEKQPHMKTIILASASPRRKQLLEQIGLHFEVDPSDYEEHIDPGLRPHELARKISLGKARVVASRHKYAVVIGADTFIVLGNQILGKPHSENEARKMLETINGKSHSVITGFSIIDSDTNKTLSGSVETEVFIKKLTRAEIDAYVKSGEPLDKAGAYAIQGLGTVIVERIKGDYFNVIGLPLSALAEALKEFGIKVL